MVNHLFNPGVSLAHDTHPCITSLLQTWLRTFCRGKNGYLVPDPSLASLMKDRPEVKGNIHAILPRFLSSKTSLNHIPKDYLPVSVKEGASLSFELCPRASAEGQLCPVWFMTPAAVVEVNLIAVPLLGSPLT